MLIFRPICFWVLSRGPILQPDEINIVLIVQIIIVQDREGERERGGKRESAIEGTHQGENQKAVVVHTTHLRN